MAQVVIIGGGISGLATAFHLQELRPELDITVLEAANRVGGTVWTERREGFQVEVGANGFLDNKASTLNLCQKLGLADRLVAAAPAARHRFLFVNGRLQSLPEGLSSFLRSPLLSWRGKLAILRERFRPAAVPAMDESVHDFASHRTNEEVAEVLIDAMVTGIYAGDPKLVSFKAAFPRVAEAVRQHGSVVKGMRAIAEQRRAEASAEGRPYQPGSRLLSFHEGLRLLIETLRDRLRKPPKLGVAVRRVERQAGESGWVVYGDGYDRWNAHAVILACPAYQQAAIVADLDSTLANSISQIPYSPVAVVALGYRRQDVGHRLDGFGYIAPQRSARDVLGVQWCSSVFPERAPDGSILLRAIAGGWNRRDIISWNGERLLEAVRREVGLSLRIESPPAFHHIVRWGRAIPQYHVGHCELVKRIDDQAGAHAGLFLTGNAYHGVALNDCTEQAERVAAKVADYLRMR